MSRIFDAMNRAHGLELVSPARRESLSYDLIPKPSANGFRKLTLTHDPNARTIFRTEPKGVAAEQFRLLRRKLAAQYPQGSSLVVSSPAAGDGKTFSAVNLAWALAEKKLPTLLVECDLRRPSIARFLGCSVAQGMESLASEKVEPEDAVAAIDGLPLYVAMVAKAHTDPVRFFNSVDVKKFFAWARSKFQWLIIDAPPIFPFSDVAELCSFAEGVLLVIRARRTSQELVTKSFEALGDRVRGVILNEATLCLDSYYRYLGRYPVDPNSKDK
jgi:Mrp family chromosome partitioning ATPase